ncbi:dextranase [Diplodia corticola]|uniref:Dextranase n=1 Tax=Diplodia corticola TaxID=236234 RepID=A0A1J9RT57_9PEZI|nr:dextranase [Diplodia corticola]OJD31052.1 dextranase [Diplodia corticola]
MHSILFSHSSLALALAANILPGLAFVVRQAGNNTANSTSLQTWWHETGEINTQTAVQDGNVRQSHLFDVQVAASSASTNFYDSFAYESIPRNGNGNICAPGNTTLCNVDDQISIEADIGVSMSWSQYLTTEDSIVRVTRTDGGSTAPDNVVIRPTTLGFDLEQDGDALLIKVPFSQNGYRFSVEFQDNLWEYRIAAPELNSHYIQNKNPSGSYYVSSYDDTNNPIVGVEPLNALLIFVSPFPSSEYVPSDEANTHRVTPGLVSGLDQVEKSILYFGPGVYYTTGSAHAKLSSSVSWVYLAPGAYVKGAIEYTSPALDLRATGFGVLSGEQYVYQANTAEGYQNIKSDDYSVKMWRGSSADGMTWTVHGVTTNAPPFNSMDFYGSLDTFSVRASDYKQVGAFFGQTDGMQAYPGSHYQDIFYHVGDDGIKTYYSNIRSERLTVWKTNNAPIVQFGWYPRSVSNITVDSVDVIHTRYISQAAEYPRALVGSAASYEDSGSTSTADTTKSLSDYTVSNWRCEGICPGLLGINPLQNIDNMKLSNVSIEQLAPHGTGVDTSTLTVFTDADNGNEPVSLGANSAGNVGLTIQDFYVGGEKITLAAGNWDSNSAGRLNIDGSYEGRWTAI